MANASFIANNINLCSDELKINALLFFTVEIPYWRYDWRNASVVRVPLLTTMKLTEAYNTISVNSFHHICVSERVH